MIEQPQPSEYKDKLSYLQAFMEWAVDCCDRANVVVVVYQTPQTPLAMRNYKSVVEVREKR